MTARTGISCGELREQVSAYVDGELPMLACDRIERHCRSCDECSALVNGLRSAIGLCRDVRHAPLPAAIRARAQARVRELLAITSAPRLRRRR